MRILPTCERESTRAADGSLRYQPATVPAKTSSPIAARTQSMIHQRFSCFSCSSCSLRKPFITVFQFHHRTVHFPPERILHKICQNLLEIELIRQRLRFSRCSNQLRELTAVEPDHPARKTGIYHRVSRARVGVCLHHLLTRRTDPLDSQFLWIERLGS